MFIYNLKLNKKFWGKFLITTFSLICLVLLAISIVKIFNEIKQESNSEIVKNNCSIPSPEVAELTSENYCNVLKEVHELNNYYPICMYREYNAKSLYIDINKPLEIEAKVSITILVK